MAKYETTHTAFLGVDLDLLENPIYSDLDIRAAVLYALYKDRAHLSLYSYTQLGNRRYIDKYGLFIIFTNELAAKALHTTRSMITKLRKDLANHGLITVRRNGLKGYKIYVNEVQRTPKNVPLILPWMNHYVEIKKTISDWTIASQIQHWNNISLASKSGVLHEREVSDATCAQNLSTSLTTSSLTTNTLNNNGLDGNAHAREEKLNPIQSPRQDKYQSANPYNTLPEKIKQSFVKTFGFITKPVAIELHALIGKSNEDMVNYVVESAYGRKVTSPINYVKAAIYNALKRGDNCVQDMINYYKNKVRSHSKGINRPKRPHYMTKKEAELQAQKDMEDLKTRNPMLWEEIQKKIKARKIQKCNKPRIPIYKLGE